MPTKYAPTTLGETLDTISWALVYAPKFKGERSLDEVFEDIEHGINRVRNRTRSVAIKEVLTECLSKLDESKLGFKGGLSKPAHQALYQAGQILRSIRSRIKSGA